MDFKHVHIEFYIQFIFNFRDYFYKDYRRNMKLTHFDMYILLLIQIPLNDIYYFVLRLSLIHI